MKRKLQYKQYSFSLSEEIIEKLRELKTQNRKSWNLLMKELIEIYEKIVEIHEKHL